MKFRWHKLKNEPEYFFKLKGGWRCILWHPKSGIAYIDISRDSYTVGSYAAINTSLADQKKYAEKLMLYCITRYINKYEEYIAMMRAEIKDIV